MYGLGNIQKYFKTHSKRQQAAKTSGHWYWNHAKSDHCKSLL